MAVRVQTENCCQFLAVWLNIYAVKHNPYKCTCLKKSKNQNHPEILKVAEGVFLGSWVPVLLLTGVTLLSVMTPRLTPAWDLA